MLARLQDFFEALKTRKVFSMLAIALAVTTVINYGFEKSYWNEDKIVQNDVIMYYGYLPAVFIFGDLQFDYAYNPCLLYTSPSPRDA